MSELHSMWWHGGRRHWSSGACTYTISIRATFLCYQEYNTMIQIYFFICLDLLSVESDDLSKCRLKS